MLVKKSCKLILELWSWFLGWAGRRWWSRVLQRLRLWSLSQIYLRNWDPLCKSIASLSNLKWVSFTGQSWPLTSLTQGGRNRFQFDGRPHGEFCPPGSCGLLHVHTSIGIKPGWLPLPSHPYKHRDKPPNSWAYARVFQPGCCRNIVFCPTSWSWCVLPAACPRSRQRWIDKPGRNEWSLDCCHSPRPSPARPCRTACPSCWKASSWWSAERRVKQLPLDWGTLCATGYGWYPSAKPDQWMWSCRGTPDMETVQRV